MLTDQTRWSLGHGKPLVPSRWQATVSATGTPRGRYRPPDDLLAFLPAL